MALSLVVYSLSTIWPFSSFKFDDIKASDHLVSKLPLPEHTKQFVYAVQEPETGSIIYILCAQSLSERSADDALCLIRAVRPDAVIAQLPDYPVPEIQADSKEDDDEENVPTSVMEVVKHSFLKGLDKEAYEGTAGNSVLKEIFGVGYVGHLVAAKNAAKEVGSSFLVIESPCAKLLGDENDSQVDAESDVLDIYPAFASSLVSQKVVSVGLKSSQRLYNLNEPQLQMIRSASKWVDAALFRLDPGICEPVQPKEDYVPPPFAQSMYPQFSELHDICGDIPLVGRALAHVQKVFDDVNAGERIDTEELYDVFTFKIMIEYVRTMLNRAGRQPLNINGGNSNQDVVLSELSVDEKSEAVLAQALRYQCGKYKSIVAVVDAECLGGLRKHWSTSLPQEVKDFVGELVMPSEDYAVDPNQSDKKLLLTSNPMLAVGVGATAVVGATSLSKVIPASLFIKLLTFKVPVASLKLMAAESHRVAVIVLSKVFGPLKAAAPGFAGYGTKSASTLKAISSANKIRAITHGVIISAEKTSFSAMRGAFYQIMRNRSVRPVGFLPWATLGCCVATCAGLEMYSEGLESAAGSLPSASSVAKLGRGIQNLREAAKQMEERPMLQKSVEAMGNKLKAKYPWF